jgi:hypothetical protein
MRTRHLILLFFFCCPWKSVAQNLDCTLHIKQPGNKSESVAMVFRGGSWTAADGRHLPLTVTEERINEGEITKIKVTLRASQDTYYNVGFGLRTSFNTSDCDFYLPGFWYHKNLRSPEQAPSFHFSNSWNVREDRLSAPLTGVMSQREGKSWTVTRLVDAPQECLTTAQQGEVILSGNTSLGYVGFDNQTGQATLTFGYPYVESPVRYIRKLTFSPSIQTFALIRKGESKTLTWIMSERACNDYGTMVRQAWQQCIDLFHPQPVAEISAEKVKDQLADYFRQSFVENHPLKYNSGISLRVDKCTPVDEIQIGFCGRVLLNAFNEIEYGDAHQDQQLSDMGRSIFDSFLQHGFTAEGYLMDNVCYGKNPIWNGVHSIRQQSEAVYAVLHYLNYERRRGARHKEWEQRVRHLLDNLLRQQAADGSFARKFHDDGSVVDSTGGSTPSATVPLVMAYHYFGDSKYLKAAKKSVDYLEQHIIVPSDYFSSTLDARCEDKEAAISAVTATYYMALVTKGKARKHYVDLCRRAAYFALSWYYLWDVPFAQGQMLGDLGLKTRGWGNVSVENNHIDVFVFELGHILQWLSEETGETRLSAMYRLMRSSLCQLMPIATRHCGVALPGYYPEVVQHTTWDYGRNGKGFYNDIFAPGWTVASLWELYSPERTERFFKK